MPLLVPAHIMIPEDGTAVFCHGIDSQNRPFSAVVGRRSGGTWTLDNNMSFQKVTHWSPVTDELPATASKQERVRISGRVAEHRR